MSEVKHIATIQVELLVVCSYHLGQHHNHSLVVELLTSFFNRLKDYLGKFLDMIGCENDDRFVRFFGIDGKMLDSIPDLFVLLGGSKCIALIFILNALVNNLH